MEEEMEEKVVEELVEKWVVMVVKGASQGGRHGLWAVFGCAAVGWK